MPTWVGKREKAVMYRLGCKPTYASGASSYTHGEDGTCIHFVAQCKATSGMALAISRRVLERLTKSANEMGALPVLVLDYPDTTVTGASGASTEQVWVAFRLVDLGQVARVLEEHIQQCQEDLDALPF